ncbi:hypothetical protein [Absidia glauca]|uniref:3-hydroxyisobutyryl-coenzyme A hydrolase n=1 Tax=Absidia glauca TaxID=4829 RepID=A0A168N1I6_ABSGL|nr:hypothetical protein [Absidia glauca]
MVKLVPTDPISVIGEKLRSLGQGTVIYKADFAPGVGLVELQQPERHNSFSGKMMAEFRDIVLALEQQSQDSDMVALVMTGSRGKSFCAGLDMVFAEEHLKGRIRSREAVNRFMYDTLTRMSRLPLITVASLAGAALGGGTELLTTFDYVCMDSTTFIRFVQTKMGVTSPWGGIHRLVDRIGRKHALRIVAGAQPIDARMAHQIGLVDKVVESSNTSKLDAYETCLAACLDLISPFVFDSKSKERVSPAAARGMKQLMARSERSTSGVIDHDMALFNSVATLAKL